MSRTSLSDLQLAVMEVLWTCEEATAAEIQKSLRPGRDLAMSTISTVLSRLRDRDLVTHRREGRGFRYRATVSRLEVRSSMVADLVDSVFGGDSEALVAHLVRQDEIDVDELSELEELVARMRENESPTEEDPTDD